MRERWAECPPEVEAAILRMLEKDPAARWPRLADAMAALGAAPLADDDPLRAELAQWLWTEGAAALTDSPTPTSPAPRTRAPGSAPGTFAIAFLEALYPERGDQLAEMAALFAREYDLASARSS